MICDDGINYENILQEIFYIDNDDLSAKILRNILLKGGSPNIKIDDIPFFENIDADFIIDIEMDNYPYKWQLDQAFNFWLVLVGFGGVIKGGRLPVTMQGDYKPEIFIEFEKFDYISSAGLRVLLSEQKVMNRQGEMKVIHVNETIREIFEVTGFTDILTIE